MATVAAIRANPAIADSTVATPGTELSNSDFATFLCPAARYKVSFWLANKRSFRIVLQ
jgi:hypothetical protein